MLINEVSFAGAWLQPKGESELIFQFENKELITYYKDAVNAGNTNSNKYVFEYYDLFYQYGARNGLTIGLEAKWFDYKSYLKDDGQTGEASILLKKTEEHNSFQRELERNVDSHYKMYEHDLFEYQVFAKTELWSNDNSIISIKPSIGGFASDKINMAGVTLLYGENFNVLSKSAYVDIEVGADNIFDSPLVDPNSIDSIKIVLDLTFGLKFTDKQTLMIQSFNHTDPLQYLKSSSGIESNHDFSNTIKLSWLYKYNSHISWQNGYSTNITNRDKYIANSVITGLWIRF